MPWSVPFQSPTSSGSEEFTAAGSNATSRGTRKTEPRTPSKTICKVASRLIVTLNFLRFEEIFRPEPLTPPRIDQFAKSEHCQQRDREKNVAGIIMINSGGEFRINKPRDQNNRKESPNITDDREHDRKGKDDELLPKFVLGKMHVNRGKH